MWSRLGILNFSILKKKCCRMRNVISEPRSGDKCGHKGAENGRHLRLHLRDSCRVDSLQQQFTNARNEGPFCFTWNRNSRSPTFSVSRSCPPVCHSATPKFPAYVPYFLLLYLTETVAVPLCLFLGLAPLSATPKLAYNNNNNNEFYFPKFLCWKVFKYLNDRHTDIHICIALSIKQNL